MTEARSVSQTPEEFMATASSPKAVAGSSAWAAGYAIELRRVLHEHAARAPRTLQSHLGPSELGVTCDRQVAGKMAALPITNHVADPWPSMRGTALHAYAEEAFSADNRRRQVLRWVTEQRVTPHPEHPGTADLYDAEEQAVVDHKFLGPSSMAKVRKGVPRHYRVQLLLYALGYWLLGLPVRRVALAAYPATDASLDGLYVADLPFTDEAGQILPDVSHLLTGVFEDTARRKAMAELITGGLVDLMQIPAEPDGDTCYFCPFWRPQSARDGGPGCPGTTQGPFNLTATSNSQK